MQFTDGNGRPLVAGSVAYCEPGTGGANYRPIWADEAETIPLENPCPLDASGIPFSGGSQVTLWGIGEYEMFLRDVNGVLIYSALISTVNLDLISEINGSLHIKGGLTVDGDIVGAGAVESNSVVTNALTASQATIGDGTVLGNWTVNGALIADSVVANNATINQNLGVGGTASANLVDAVLLNVHNGAEFNGSSIEGVDQISARHGNFDTITVSSGDHLVPTMQVGATQSDPNIPNLINVVFPKAFNTIEGAVIVPSSGIIHQTYFSNMRVDDLTVNGFTMNSSDMDAGSDTFILYWIAFGT
jgi:hypothetical protein